MKKNVYEKMKNPFVGKKGETLFYQSYQKIFKENENISFFKRIDKSGDQRSLTILAAIIIENRIDKLLKLYLPRYDRKDIDFTFSIKIKLLKASKLIPIQLLNFADCIRKVRNEFAHNQIDNVDNITVGVKKRINSLFDTYGFETEKQQVVTSFFDKLKSLIFYTIVGIGVFEQNLIILRQTLDSKKFIETLNHIANENIKDEIELIKDLSQKNGDNYL